MSDHINLDLIDTDGAIREAEENLGDTRASFFRKAALAGSASFGAGALLGGFPGAALAAKPSTKQDVAILNYALTLEYLENEFYKLVLKNGLVKTPAYLSTVQLVQKDEAAHVKAIPGFIKLLGGKAVSKPKFDFSGAKTDEKSIIATAAGLEDVGVSAYAGQGPRIKNKIVVVKALGIHSVEARHAAVLRVAAGLKPVIKTIDTPRTMGQVLKLAGPYLPKKK